MKSNYKRIAFIGQAPPKTMPDRPFDRSALYKWLASVEITLEILDECAEFFALIDYFPRISKQGGHLVPTNDQIAEARPRLKQKLLEFKPEIIVPIGSLSISEALRNYKEFTNSKSLKLENIIGEKFIADPYNIFSKELSIIPLPHPSGASTWIYKDNHSQLLQKALNLIKENLLK